MITEIPTFTDAPMYTLDIELDGELYSLRLLWSERADCWLLDLRDSAGEAIVLGRPCLVGNLLTLGYGEPAGHITVIGDRDPKRYDWGTRCKLVYLDEDELEELLA